MTSRRAAFKRTACLACFLVGLAAAAAGCGGRHHPEDEPEADPNAPTPLTVQNNNWLDVVVYVYHDGVATRIATVTAASTGNYFLAPWMLGHSRLIRLIGHAVGANTSISTELIHVQAGQFVVWTLETDLSRSTVSVY